MNYTRGIIKEFQEKKELYHDYCLAVNNLLEALLRRGRYKYQLSHRIKSLDSLVEKIKRKKLVGKIYKRLADVKDVAGVRIVFYTEADRKQFIRDLFRALGKKLKLKEAIKKSGYCSTHALLTFNPDRTRLDEYRKFKGLKCELQLTLMLDHAWAEVEHDIFYKEDPSLKASSQSNYLTLKERMKKLMHDHIRQAALGLESVIRHVKRLEG